MNHGAAFYCQYPELSLHMKWSQKGVQEKQILSERKGTWFHLFNAGFKSKTGVLIGQKYIAFITEDP